MKFDTGAKEHERFYAAQLIKLAATPSFDPAAAPVYTGIIIHTTIFEIKKMTAHGNQVCNVLSKQ